jgi:hypothetical protein
LRAMVSIRPKLSFWPDCSTSTRNYGWLFICPFQFDGVFVCYKPCHILA